MRTTVVLRTVVVLLLKAACYNPAPSLRARVRIRTKRDRSADLAGARVRRSPRPRSDRLCPDSLCRPVGAGQPGLLSGRRRRGARPARGRGPRGGPPAGGDGPPPPPRP